MRFSDTDLNALFRAVNEGHFEGDPLGTIELLEADDADIRVVPPQDLRGARRAMGMQPKNRGRNPSGLSGGVLFMLLGVGGASSAARRNVGRREVLQAALLLVGGLCVEACSNQPSPYEPPARDLADASVGGDASADGEVEDAGSCNDFGDAEMGDGGVPDGGAPGSAGTGCGGSGTGSGDQGGYTAGGGVG
jgi:hypothetical protein